MAAFSIDYKSGYCVSVLCGAAVAAVQMIINSWP